MMDSIALDVLAGLQNRQISVAEMPRMAPNLVISLLILSSLLPLWLKYIGCGKEGPCHVVYVTGPCVCVCVNAGLAAVGAPNTFSP